METISDLYREFVDACGTEAPTRTQDEVQQRFHSCGMSSYRTDGPRFLMLAFAGGNPGEWPWGGDWPYGNSLPDEPYHITSIRADGVYGHNATYCDPAGCSGNELYLGPMDDWPGIEAGHVYERGGDGIVVEVEE